MVLEREIVSRTFGKKGIVFDNTVYFILLTFKIGVMI